MMRLGVRKLTVLALIAGVFLLANVWMVANWLEEKGVTDAAKYLRKEYLTGTAITIIVVLLILLVKPTREVAARAAWFRRCPVCDHRLHGSSNYCSECGSKA